MWLTETDFGEKHRQTSPNEWQQKILHLLLDNFAGNLTTTRWAKITKTSAGTTLRDIQDLIGKGILERQAGGSKITTYALI